MYLSDNDIRSKLGEISFVTYDAEHPFRADEQIQPCSIDLRLSDVFWQPIRRKTVDLRRSRLLEVAPRLLWRKRILKKGEYISLKPNELLLGRIYEKFSVPNDCAGKIEGRSSFARLGLSIHCTGEFINPGYRGHMPLQLLNSSPHTIKIFPFIPICQLVFVRLTSVPKKLYGDTELQHKYEDDDGGPSYWWRDKRIKSLQQAFRDVDIALDIQQRILEKIGHQEPEIIERLESMVNRLPTASLQNAAFILDEFVRHERKRKLISKIVTIACHSVFPAFLSASVGICFVKPIGNLHWAIWILTLLSTIPFVYPFLWPTHEYLTEYKQN